MLNENVFYCQSTDNKAHRASHVLCTINRVYSIDVLHGTREASQDKLQRVLK